MRALCVAAPSSKLRRMLVLTLVLWAALLGIAYGVWLLASSPTRRRASPTRSPPPTAQSVASPSGRPEEARCRAEAFHATARLVLHEGPAAPVSRAFRRAFLSREHHVSLAECKCRCSAAAVCRSFTYAAAAGACHLKMRCVGGRTPLVSPSSWQAKFRTYFKASGCAAARGAEKEATHGYTPSLCSPLTGTHALVPARPRIIWSYWHSRAIPTAVAGNVFSWVARNPGWIVRLLNEKTVKCYLPEDQFADVASVPLRADLIRLALLYRYGGVWMDSLNVLLDPLDAFIPWPSLEAGGIYAITDERYSNPLTTDFVESWMLAACSGSVAIKLWGELLTTLVRSNGGSVKGLISSHIYDNFTRAAYFKIDSFMPAPEGPDYWAEYLVICAAFTYLYHHHAVFRSNYCVRAIVSSKFDATHRVGYMLQLYYNWSIADVNKVLLAPRGTHPLHSQLLTSRIVKLSTNNMAAIDARRGILRDILLLPDESQLYERHSFQLVITRCDESLSWTEPYRGVRSIYDKCAEMHENDRHPADVYVQSLNVGREAETILTYLVAHYDVLPEYVAFSQGELDPAFEWTRSDYGPGMFSEMLQEARRSGCSDALPVHPDSEGEFGFSFNASQSGMAKYRNVRSQAVTSDFGSFFHHVLGLRLSSGELLSVYPGATMVISRAHLLVRTRAYYAELLRHVNYDTAPVEAQYLERSWYHIFRCADSKFTNPPPPRIKCAADFNTSYGCCGNAHLRIPESEQCPRLRPKCVDNHPGLKWGHCVKEKKQ
ncbi:hypothetical protein AB1Y20_000815 [Prymnesium parvum]|uniref:Apple domain-containing protein n=1 Tax=Prymnesium parvum TaxID=97485 RepID=A0AB34KA76_PRYPA